MKPLPIFVVCHGSFKDVHQVSIALGFHFVVGNEPKGCAVDAVPDPVGGFRIIFKDMAQMGIACPASYLNALHSMAIILDLNDGWFLDGLCEGRPAAAALVFICGGEQRLAGDDVHVDSLGEMIPEFILIGIFRPAFLGDGILLRSQRVPDHLRRWLLIVAGINAKAGK